MSSGRTLTGPLVDGDWVATHRVDERVRVLEVDVAPAAYRQGHIPDAVLWNIYADLRHPDYCPITAAELERLLSRSGIDRESTIVVYGYGAHLGFWLLQSHGHERVRLLDGPREQWLQAGRSWSLEEWAPAPRTYPKTRRDPATHASVEAVLAMIGRPGQVVLDVRSQAEYDGERFWPSGAAEGAGRAGHIPGSVHLPIERLRDSDGRFRSPDAMRDALLTAGVSAEQRVVTYCTIGNRASQAWYALSQVLDYPDTGVYFGSWAEWGTRYDTPIER